MKPDVKRKRGRPVGAVQRLTIQEVADMLRKPLQTIYTYTRQLTVENKPVLPVTRYGRGPNSVRVLLTDVDKLPERLAMRPPPAFSFSKNARSGCKKGKA